jgi:hypothetical protein
VWGLSHYLISERNWSAEELRESALQWLRFIRPDYYVVQGLKARGVEPSTYGLREESSCYSGKCELPFVEGGCGGMAELRL